MSRTPEKHQHLTAVKLPSGTRKAAVCLPSWMPCADEARRLSICDSLMFQRVNDSKTKRLERRVTPRKDNNKITVQSKTNGQQSS